MLSFSPPGIGIGIGIAIGIGIGIAIGIAIALPADPDSDGDSDSDPDGRAGNRPSGRRRILKFYTREGLARHPCFPAV
jgi:hypothetical protein